MFDDDETDEFGGRRRRRRRRKARREKRSDRRSTRRARRKTRRAKGRGLARLKKLKKIGKPFKKLVTSKVFKKILSFIPVYGPAAVQAIEAGEAIAKKAKGKVDKVVDIEEQMKAAAAAGDMAKVRRLKAQGEKAAAEARKELKALGKAKLAERKIVKRVGMRARAGDRKARSALRRLRTEPKARAELQKAAVKSVKRKAPFATKAPPKGKVVVLIGGRRFTFDRRELRRKVS